MEIKGRQHQRERSRTSSDEGEPTRHRAGQQAGKQKGSG